MGEMFDLINFNLSDFIFQLINLGIIVFFLHKFLFTKVMSFIDARNNEVNNVYKDIDDAWDEIKNNERKYSSLLSNVKVETNELLNQAKSEGKAIKEKIENEARQKAEEELQRARQAIEAEKNTAIEEIKNNISELVIQGAEVVLKKEVSATSHKTLIDDFIDNLGDENE